jgi:hypothetical protein
MILTTFQPDWLPILRKVQDLEIVTVNTKFHELLNDAEIKSKPLASFANQEMADYAARETARMVAELYHSEFDISKLPFDGTTLATGSSLASYAYMRLYDIISVMMVVDLMQPKLILVHNDVEPLNRALALWALQHRVPCLHIPHAIYLDTEGRGPAGTDVHDLITASMIACAGPYQQQWYIERGAYPQTTIITGLPQFERLAKPQPNRERACKLLGLDPKKPIVMYKSSWRQDTNIAGCHDGVEETYNAFLAMTKLVPDVQYVVSCHPRGNNLKWHADMASEAGVECAITQEHLDVLMNAADILLCYGPSNVIMEMATLNTSHLVCVNDAGAYPQDSEVIKCPANPEQMAEVVKACLASPIPDYRNFVYKYLGPQDGNNNERITQIIRQVHGI